MSSLLTQFTRLSPKWKILIGTQAVVTCLLVARRIDQENFDRVFFEKRKFNIKRDPSGNLQFEDKSVLSPAKQK